MAITLSCGQMFCVNGIPVRLLYLVEKIATSEKWRCEMLFVEAEERDVIIGKYDRISFFHGGHI